MPNDFNFKVDPVPLAEDKTLKEITASSSRIQDCAVVQVGAFLYVTRHLFRWRAEDNEVDTYIGVLDTVQHKWRWIQLDGPIASRSHLFVVDSSLFMYGEEDWKNKRSGKMSRLDLILEEWSFYDTHGEHPGARTSFCGSYIESQQTYLVHGGQVDLISWPKLPLLILSLAHRRWFEPVQKGRAPANRIEHGSCVQGNVVYYFGGNAGETAFKHLCMLRLNPNNDVVTWSWPQTNPAMLSPLWSFAFFPFQGKLLLVGGRRGGLRSRFRVYDPHERRFDDVELAERDKGLIESGSTAFVAADGKSMGLFGGENMLESYVRISVPV